MDLKELSADTSRHSEMVLACLSYNLKASSMGLDEFPTNTSRHNEAVLSSGGGKYSARSHATTREYYRVQTLQENDSTAEIVTRSHEYLSSTHTADSRYQQEIRGPCPRDVHRILCADL